MSSVSEVFPSEIQLTEKIRQRLPRFDTGFLLTQFPFLACQSIYGLTVILGMGRGRSQSSIWGAKESGQTRERGGEWPQHCMTGRPCKVGVNGGWWVMSGGLSMKKGPQYDLMQGM